MSLSIWVPVDQTPPFSIVRHLSDTVTATGSMREGARSAESVEARIHHTVDWTFGPNQGLLNGRKLSIGTVRGLTILVNFADVNSTTTAADVEWMTNGPDYTLDGNISSVRDYFLTVSNGKLDYTNTVVGPYTLSQDRAFYISNLLVVEALALAVADGVRTNLYLLTGLGRNSSELTIGTFRHENGHLLCRFPDMYDYGSRSTPTIPAN